MTKSAISRLFAFAVFAVAILPAKTPAALNAVWVDSASLAPNPVTDPAAQLTLIQNTAASGVNMLYLSVYSSTPNSDGLLMYDSSAIASLISGAHTHKRSGVCAIR